MTGYKTANLSELIAEIGESQTKSILSDFSCPLNHDVEHFLRFTAIEFAKQGVAATHLVFAEYKNQPVLVGYFTLSNKYLVVKRDGQISETLRKRIAKFCTYNHDMKRHELAAPLIAQLGKNFANGFDQLITGDELLQMACDRVASVLLALGGKSPMSSANRTLN